MLANANPEECNKEICDQISSTLLVMEHAISLNIEWFCVGAFWFSLQLNQDISSSS